MSQNTGIILKEGETLGKKVQKTLFSLQIMKRALLEGQNLTLNFHFGSRLSTFELKVHTKLNPQQLLNNFETTFDQKVLCLIKKVQQCDLQK